MCMYSRSTKSNLVDKVPQYDEVELEKTITRADITAVRTRMICLFSFGITFHDCHFFSS